MFIMPHAEINERVETGRMFWAKYTRFKSGAAEFSVSKVQEGRLRWINNELPRKQKICPITVEWARGKSKSQIAAEVERFAQMEKEAKAEKSKKSAVSRARQSVRMSLKMIEADHMLTLNYRENVEDIERVKVDWQKFVRLVREVHPEWRFVCVPERQERGAWHLHIGVHGRQDVKLLRKLWYITLGGTGKEVGKDTPGQVDVKGPDKRWRQEGQGGIEWHANKLAAYLTKYLGKTFDECAKHAKRYWSSKGSKPVVHKHWLAASSLMDAVLECYDFFENSGHAGCFDVRCRDGFIWLTATCEECPF